MSKEFEEYERMWELAACLLVRHSEKLKSMKPIERGCVFYNIAKKANFSNVTLFQTIVIDIETTLEYEYEEIDNIVEWVSKGCPKE